MFKIDEEQDLSYLSSEISVLERNYVIQPNDLLELKVYTNKGEQIIVQRGKDRSYALTPVNEDDVYFCAEMVKKIKLSAEQAKNGEVIRITSSEEINDLLGL